MSTSLTWLGSLRLVEAGEWHHVDFSSEVALSFPDSLYEEMQLWFRRQRIVLATRTTQSDASVSFSEPLNYSPQTTVIADPVSYPETVEDDRTWPATVSTIPSLEDLVDHVKIEDVNNDLKESDRLHYKDVIAQLFVKFPEEMVERLDFLTLRYVDKGSRGLAGANSMILRVGGKLSDEEITAVAVHEFGHIVDLGYLRGNTFAGVSSFKDGAKDIYTDDRSLAFYTISWKNDQERKVSSTEEDFVSGYAMSDPFEDFAESFIMYVLHGPQFKHLAEYNTALSQKYTYFRDTVFDGNEFLSNTKSLTNNYVTSRPWDATLEKYDYDAYKNIDFHIHN